MPHPLFGESAKILDPKRLGKQRVEASTILKVLTGEIRNSRWRRHPAVRMWAGYEEALKHYYNCIVSEWVQRGYKNEMSWFQIGMMKLPPWIGDVTFHASHRSALLTKCPAWYSKFGWTDVPKIEYVWPA